MSTNQPLIPSLLYTQGDVNVQRDEENDLKVPDPDPEVAEAAIAKETIHESVSKSAKR